MKIPWTARRTYHSLGRTTSQLKIFDKMDLSILVKSPFHSAYISKSVIAVSSKLNRERAQKS